MDGDGANKKRGTERQLTKDNYKEDDGHGDEGDGNFERASEAELKTRHIRRVRRAPTLATTTGANPFAGISLTTATPTQETTPPTKSAALNAAEPTQEKEETPNKPTQSTEKSETEVEATSEVEEKPLAVSLDETPTKSSSAGAPSASSVDPSRFQPIEIKSGEEGEDTVFAEKAVLFTNSEGKWTSCGVGEVKINVNAQGTARLIMRQEVTLQLLLNARLYPEMKPMPMPMAENAVTFSCQNYLDKAFSCQNYLDKAVESEKEETKNVVDIFAIRFRTDAKTKVQNFTEAIEKYKNSSKSAETEAE